MVELVALKKGPARETEASEAIAPEVGEEIRKSKLPNADDPGAIESVLVPRLTGVVVLLIVPSSTVAIPVPVPVVPASLMRGSVLLLVKLDRTTLSRLKSAVTLLSLALRSGPLRLTLAGATSSAAGAPENVSKRLKKFPPDWASGPALKVELVSWSRADVVVLES